ncbi:Na+-translocating ferredoxin:NAD+ oxidoreductase RnfD subunit [Azospirillaceae bacterium]
MSTDPKTSVDQIEIIKNKEPIKNQLSHALKQDPRHLQLSAQCILLTLLSYLNFGPPVIAGVALITSAIITQAIGSYLHGLPRLEIRSALITGFSLTFLVRADFWWLYVIAGTIAIGSKFILRVSDRHLFNPSNFAIVCLLLTTDHIRISSGEWGKTIWLVALFAFMCALVLRKIGRLDISLFFLGAYTFLHVGRTLWLNEPWEIAFYHLENGNLFLFSFFMITDPKTTPEHRVGRLIYAIFVTILGYWLDYVEHLTSPLLVSLAILSPFVHFFNIKFFSSPFFSR